MPQVTPYKGSNTLETIALGNQLNSRSRQLEQQDQRIAQQDRSLDQNEDRLSIAAQQAGLKREEYARLVMNEAIGNSRNPQQAAQLLEYYTGVRPDEKALQSLQRIPVELFGGTLKDRDLKARQLDSQGNKVLGSGQVLVNNQGEVIAEGATNPLDEPRLRKAEADAQLSEDKAAESGRQEVAAESTRADIVDTVDQLLGSDTDRIFGSIVGVTEPILSQEGRNIEAVRNRLVSLLTTGNLDKMKGVLSNTDIQILQQAGTLLGDRGISDELATQELKRIRSVFSRNKERLDGDDEAQSGHSIGRFKVRVK